jgi:O-succinylbenzoic acid--CoA ligase
VSVAGDDRFAPTAPSMPDWLRRRARLTPHRLALRAGSERLSFRELDQRVDLAAAELARRGVTAGSRVALLLGNGVPFAVLIHALARLRAVAVPLNARLAPPELAWQLGDCRATVLVCDAPRIDAADAPGLIRLEAGAVAGASVERRPRVPADPEPGIEPQRTQGIIYTSATSGRPKGVMLTYGNHWWSAVGSALHLGLRPDDCWLAALPLYHVGGLAILWRSVIHGTAVVIHEGFEAGAVNHEIDSGGITLTSVVSAMLEEVLDSRGGRRFAPSLRCVLLGGGPASADLIERAAALGAPLAPTYGLTEAASQVATLLPDEVPRKPGSSGQPLFPTEVRIDAPAGEIGEILVRGPTVMAGYADRPHETAAVLRDGWLHTGDFGRLDEAGYLYVVDRREDLIVSGGENVYPSEVERALLLHPAVLGAGVVGLPDARWGQRVAAVVALRRGAAATEEDLRDFVARQIARYKVPRRIWVVEAIPRAAGGKIARRAIREWVAERLAREGA